MKPDGKRVVLGKSHLVLTEVFGSTPLLLPPGKMSGAAVLAEVAAVPAQRSAGRAGPSRGACLYSQCAREASLHLQDLLGGGASGLGEASSQGLSGTLWEGMRLQGSKVAVRMVDGATVGRGWSKKGAGSICAGQQNRA